jgi:hypothetical protein
LTVAGANFPLWNRETPQVLPRVCRYTEKVQCVFTRVVSFSSPGRGKPPLMIANRWLQLAAVLLWLIGVTKGTAVLLAYENTSAQAAQAPVTWPTDSAIARQNDRFTLVMLAHPNCPCTRASLAELEIIMAHTQGRAVSVVLFSKPGSNPVEISNSALWRKAETIPGVQAIYDRGGVESRRFDGRASGQTMLYGPAGNLIFSGGITVGRGHQGDNAGADAIIHLVNGVANISRDVPPARTSVYGCALNNPASPAEKARPPWQW